MASIPEIITVYPTRGSEELSQSGAGRNFIEVSNGCFARSFGPSEWTKLRVGMRYRFIPSSSIMGVSAEGFVFYPNSTLMFGLCSGTAKIPGDQYADHFMGVSSIRTVVGTGSLALYVSAINEASVGNFRDMNFVYSTSSSLYDYSSSFFPAKTTEYTGPTATTSSTDVLFFDITRGTAVNLYTASIFSWYSLSMQTKTYIVSGSQMVSLMQTDTPALPNHSYRKMPLSTFNIDEVASGSFDTVAVYWNKEEPKLQILDLYVARLA